MNLVMNKKMKLFKNQKGMTLIELLAVVVILGVLAAVAGAAVVNGFDKSKANSNATTKNVIEDAVQRYIMDNSTAISDTATTITIAQLKSGGYLKSTPKWSNGNDIVDIDVKYSGSNDKTLSFTYDPVSP